MPELVVGQKGTATLKMYAADGRETDKYQTGSVVYSSTNEAALPITVDPANEKLATVEVLAEGTDITLHSRFDADPDEELRELEYQAGPYTIVLPPPGETVSATFEVAWEPVPTQ